jgi:adenylate cyclase
MLSPSKTRPRSSIRFTWPFWMAFACVIPLGILLVRTLSVVRRGFESSEQELEQLVVSQVAQGLQDRLARAEESASRIGSILGDHEIPDAQRLTLVSDLLSTEHIIERIGVYDAKHVLIDEMQRGSSHGTTRLPNILPELKDEANVWLPTTFLGDVPEIQFMAPIGKAGSVTGWVLARIDPEVLQETVASVTQKVFDGAEGRLVVLSREGKRIAGTGNAAKATRLIKLEKLDEAGDSGSDALLAWSGLAFEGETVNASILPMGKRAWRVVVIRPESEAFPDLAKTRRELGIASGALLIAAVLLGGFLARRTAQPILSLVALTEAYAKRDFAQRSEVRTGNELELLGNSLTGMADSLAASDKEIARRAAVEAGLSRYLPEAVAKKIAAGEGKLELGGERKTVSIVFADVVAFTQFSNSAEPEKVVAFLNELFGLISEIVFKHNGLVDKFMGDSVMAIFGTPDEKDHAARALACAEDMHRFIANMQDEWMRTFAFDVRLGIGVATGAAVVGNLGSTTRMEYTAIGDVVNTAARLESLARPGQTLLTDAVMKAAGDAFEYQSLGEQMLRGKSTKTELFELVTS